MASGEADFGGGSELAHVHDGSEVPEGLRVISVSDLTGPQDGEPDQTFTLTAEKKNVTLSSGTMVEAWTFNGQIPGPQLRVKQGELVEVTLVNRDIEDGATIHWHGLDVPNAEDGVAGATQDAVMPGQTHTYRFVAEQTGTFWYHSHQHSREAVSKGLFGSLIVEPADLVQPEPDTDTDAAVDEEQLEADGLTEPEINEPAAESGSDAGDEILAGADGLNSGLTLASLTLTEQSSAWTAEGEAAAETATEAETAEAPVEAVDAAAAEERDFTVMTHLWGSTFAIGANDQVQRFDVAPGTQVRMRLINTDDWVRQSYMLVGTSFQVAAIDGTDLNAPGMLTNEKLVLTTGGRYDLTFTMPDGPVYLSVAGREDLGLFLSPDGNGDIPSIPAMKAFDPLHYGEPSETAFDANSTFDRSFTMVLDNMLGFYNGTFDQLYTMNGEVFPNTPMYMVREGDLVKMTIVNRGMVDHPMHLHGHHALVLSRNGEPADGSAWWTDTLDVQPGETYEIAFRADNPGLWMDHCHNLVHAKAGMSMHLMYEGIAAPYTVGEETQNHPE
nr:multicopper oxidase family protein [Paenibacillus phyllosphaerae]